jgi:hypothetical protein
MVESAPRQDGRNMTMVLHPLKRPSSGSAKDGRRPPTKSRPTAPPSDAPAPAPAMQAGAAEET